MTGAQSRSIKFGLVVFLIAALVLSVIGFSRATLEAPLPSLLVSDRQGEFLAELSQNDERGHGFCR